VYGYTGSMTADGIALKGIIETRIEKCDRDGDVILRDIPLVQGEHFKVRINIRNGFGMVTKTKELSSQCYKSGGAESMTVYSLD
jgi:hypothetical protein